MSASLVVAFSHVEKTVSWSTVGWRESVGVGHEAFGGKLEGHYEEEGAHAEDADYGQEEEKAKFCG